VNPESSLLRRNTLVYWNISTFALQAERPNISSSVCIIHSGSQVLPESNNAHLE